MSSRISKAAAAVTIALVAASPLVVAAPALADTNPAGDSAIAALDTVAPFVLDGATALQEPPSGDVEAETATGSVTVRPRLIPRWC